MPLIKSFFPGLFFLLLFFGGFFFCDISSTRAATLYYNNATLDNNWGTLGNWWNDAGFSDPASGFPVPGDDVIVSENVFSNSEPDPTVNTLTVTLGEVDIFLTVTNGATFNGFSSYASGTITGDVTFNESSFNGGTVDGDATFNDGSFNGGAVTHDATFNNDSYNDGTVDGNATFYDDSTNSNTITGNATFNDGSFNEDVVDGDATFNDNSFNDGGVNGNATFNDSSANHGNVSGDAAFNDASSNSGTVLGTITFGGTPAQPSSEDNEPQAATITSWKGEVYQKLGATCPRRLRITIRGKDFSKKADVRIGNTKALSLNKKNSHKLIANFCLTKLLKVQTSPRRTLSITNPHAEIEKSKKKFDLIKILSQQP